jgi:hypothetical protein
VDTRLANNGGNALALEGGDSFTIVGSEAFAAPTAGDVFRLQDGDGTTVDLIHGTGVTGPTTGNSVFTLNAATVTIGGQDYTAGRVLTVTINTGLVFDDDTNTPSDGTIEGLSSEALIIVQSGTTDVSGNQLQINGSADVKIDSE